MCGSAKVVVSREECRKKELGRVGPRTTDPPGGRTPFRDTPHAKSLLSGIVQCPKIAASGRVIRRACREHGREQKSAFRPRGDAKTAAAQLGSERRGAGARARKFATLPTRNHNFWTAQCPRRRREFIRAEKIARATCGTLPTRKRYFRTLSGVFRIAKDGRRKEDHGGQDAEGDGGGRRGGGEKCWFRVRSVPHFYWKRGL